MTNAEILKLINLLSIAIDKMSDDEKSDANNLNKLRKTSGKFDINKSSINFNASGIMG